MPTAKLMFSDQLIPNRGKNRAFGFNIRVRNHLIGRRVPSSLAKFAFEGLSYDDQHNIQYDEKRFYIKNMAWGELGLNYAQIIQKRGNVIITGGGSLKLLSGIANAAIIAKEMRFEVDSTDLSLPNYKGQMVFTVPGANKGFGLGLDLGVEYKRMIKDDNSFHIPHHRRGNCLIKEYKYKIGVSMLDLGYINFNKTTSNYKFDGDSISLTNYVSNPPDGISDVTNAIDNAISASGAEVEKKDKAFATLPLTFMIQGDYNFENNFYLNAQLLVGMQQINFSGAERMTTFTITPRYELEKITVAMPFSVYRYGKPGLGIYARLWWLSAGTNNFLPILLKNDMYGADAYVSLNIPLFRSKDCKSFIQHKGDYCPKPKLKIFDLSKITGNKRNKKHAERARYRRVKKSRRKAK